MDRTRRVCFTAAPLPECRQTAISIADSTQETAEAMATAEPTVTPKQDHNATQVFIGMSLLRLETLVIFCPLHRQLEPIGV